MPWFLVGNTLRNYMLKPKRFIVGMFLALSLSAKPFVCNGNPCVNFGGWLSQKLREEERIMEEERRKRDPVFLMQEVRKMFDEIKKQNEEIIKLLSNGGQIDENEK